MPNTAERRLRAGARRSGAALCIAALLAAVASGCGGSSGRNATEQAVEEGVKKSAALRRAAEARAPKGASPTLRAIYAQFPPPKPDPEIKGSAAAIAAGRRACAGKTPTQVKETFLPVAIAKGALKADSPEAKMIERIATYERNLARDASFAAGQLAADAYQATLRPAVAQFGYRGCVYSLAVTAERRLAPRP